MIWLRVGDCGVFASMVLKGFWGVTLALLRGLSRTGDDIGDVGTPGSTPASSADDTERSERAGDASPTEELMRELDSVKTV